MKNIYFIFFITINLSYLNTIYGSSSPEEEHGVLYPTSCEVCKYLAVELERRLEETGKTHDVIVTGYDHTKQKSHKYAQSELRLVESLEGICDSILQYNIHKERKDSTRFAKGMSQTFQTLHGLVDKGVKVELGIPYDLWDKPSAEVVAMKTQCETLLEKHEDDIEDWFFHQQNVPLKHFLCTQKALKKGDDGCLLEDISLDTSKMENTPSKKTAKPTKKQKKKEEL